MNLTDLTTYITQQTQMLNASDITSCQMFLSKQYELIYDGYLWKDSLAMVQIPFDPVNNQDNAEGIVLLPTVIDRVVGVRTACNAVRIQGLEQYYRIDFDSFCSNGQNSYGYPNEFVILSPVWFVWRGNTGLTLIAAQDAPNLQANPPITGQFKVIWRDANGIQYVQLLTNGAQLLSPVSSTGIPPLDKNLINLAASNVDTVNGNYALNVPSFPAGYYISQLGNTPGNLFQIAPTGIPATPWTINVLGADPTDPTTWYWTGGSPLGPWTVAVLGSGPSPTASYQTAAKIEIEALFKYVTNGPVSISPITSYDAAGQTLPASCTHSPSYQRIRLFSKPTNALTLNVLGKKPFIPLDYASEVPAIKNLDNCLISFGVAAMLKRARQFGKAQQELTQAVALLKELALLETVQAANYQKFTPEIGYGDEYFGPGNGVGLGDIGGAY